MKSNGKMFTLVSTVFLISSSFLFNISVASDAEVGDETLFTYDQGRASGPQKWSKLNPHWRVCESGKLQSPIDLTNERVNVVHEVGLWERRYKTAPAVIKNRGHDIMVSWIGDAGEIIINGTDYKLKQCHWHSPSEHTINGTRHEVELHMVHESSKGETAVVGVLYKIGKPDLFLSRLLHGITQSDSEEEINAGIVDPRDIRYRTRKFYRYIGSLTVPPCTEGVIWTVVKRVSTMSNKQVKALRDAVQDGFEANARPIQRRDGRSVWYYDPVTN